MFKIISKPINTQDIPIFIHPCLYWTLHIVTYKGIKHTNERANEFYLRRTSVSVMHIVRDAPMPIDVKVRCIGLKTKKSLDEYSYYLHIQLKIKDRIYFHVCLEQC